MHYLQEMLLSIRARVAPNLSFKSLDSLNSEIGNILVILGKMQKRETVTAADLDRSESRHRGSIASAASGISLGSKASSEEAEDLSVLQNSEGEGDEITPATHLTSEQGGVSGLGKRTIPDELLSELRLTDFVSNMTDPYKTVHTIGSVGITEKDEAAAELKLC